MIHFVGAGSGGADLITVRGARLLGEADQIIYAGSLVNPDVLQYKKDGCKVLDSASMTLEEVIAAMKEGRRRAGTPFGSTPEIPLCSAPSGSRWTCWTRRRSATTTPGVSSFCGGGGAEGGYTLPDVSQSVIITRMEGRTPVPEGEKLRKMASHGCTMVLFPVHRTAGAGAGGADGGGLRSDTPAAIVHKATWPDEKGVSLHRFHPGPDGEGKQHHQDRPHHHRRVPWRSIRPLQAVRSHLYPRVPERHGGMRLALIFFTRKGGETAGRLVSALERQGHACRLSGPERFAASAGAQPYESLDGWAAEQFETQDGLIFISACGIAVRAVAPYEGHKLTDPAVVSVDEGARSRCPCCPAMWGSQRPGQSGGGDHRRNGGDLHGHRRERTVRGGSVGGPAGDDLSRPGAGQADLRRPAGGRGCGRCRRLSDGRSSACRSGSTGASLASMSPAGRRGRTRFRRRCGSGPCAPSGRRLPEGHSGGQGVCRGGQGADGASSGPGGGEGCPPST